MSDTLYNRNSFITSDANGNDPLTDKLISKIQGISYTRTFVVQKMDEFRPDKIAAKIFGDSELYWLILEYNKLSSFAEIVPGLELKIPSFNELNNLLLTANTQVTNKTLYIK
jgi:nucleoid-associated protein YgaU